MMQTEAATTETPKPSPFSGETCKECAHLPVCGVYRAIAPLMESWKGEPPFKPETLAQICSQYFPKTLKDTLVNQK